MIRRYFEKAGWGRLLVMVVGNIFLGLGIAVFKLSGLGNDPYSGRSEEHTSELQSH